MAMHIMAIIKMVRSMGIFNILIIFSLKAMDAMIGLIKVGITANGRKIR
jgi:hypothetical protein